MAQAHGLRGWVLNGSGAVVIHAEGLAENLARFEAALIAEAPPLARPHLECAEDAEPESAAGFEIRASAAEGDGHVHLPPDLFCCADCVAELEDPRARRHRYPFTNCTQCGPRYTIIEALPYDRPNTSMSGFALCEACRREYEDPRDRRFHAQPLACPECGPQMSFRRGENICTGEDALTAAIACLREGGIVAVKGVGGYHLMCDAANDEAVPRLRARKHRPHKPLAVMFPETGNDGLAAIRAHVVLDDAEAAACADPLRPIVLARKREESALGGAIAPGLCELGVFLPYSPVHHLLLAEFGGPLVATSGNVSGEPVLTENRQAEARLSHVADSFLHHNRPIVRPADDSVLRVIGGRARLIRAGRGVAPIEMELPQAFAEPTLAVGGHMKNTVALGWGHRAVISPHIGDLDSPRSLDVFARIIADLQALYRVEARRIVCDAHPGYASTRWAMAQDLPAVTVRHHMAHASALAGEYPDIARWLVFTWDGIGLGEDGGLWGGEALTGAPGAWRRAGSMRRFHVSGGDRAGREPWRSAAALMWEAGREWHAPIANAALAHAAWQKRIGTARTSSVGRLFDAAASLVLGVHEASFEGQGPMMLESVAVRGCEAIALPLVRDARGIFRTDWEPLLALLADDAIAAPTRAGIFHETLAQALAQQAAAIAGRDTFDAVGLAGGVFQNRLLGTRALAHLSAHGFRACLPRLLPANDGGLSFGQLCESGLR
jgi:hydrogenase maturation protein HypF